jgi:hypothetical protein
MSALRLKTLVERILTPWVDLLVKRKTALGAVMSKHNRPAARGEKNSSVKRLLTVANCEITAERSAREQAAGHKAAINSSPNRSTGFLLGHRLVISLSSVINEPNGSRNSNPHQQRLLTDAALLRSLPREKKRPQITRVWREARRRLSKRLHEQKSRRGSPSRRPSLDS